MFKINDYIVYGPMSVCKIIDIIEEENPYIGLKSYYVSFVMSAIGKKLK